MFKLLYSTSSNESITPYYLGHSLFSFLKRKNLVCFRINTILVTQAVRIRVEEPLAERQQLRGIYSSLGITSYAHFEIGRRSYTRS